MTARLGLTADEVLTTTRSVRKRLDLERSVPRDVLVECIEIAHQAPTGSNLQGWRWLFVDDPVKKKALADMYRANFYPYVNDPNRPQRDDQNQRIVDSATYLADVLDRVPVMLIPLIAGRLDTDADVRPGLGLGIAPSGGVEFHVGFAQKRAWFCMDDVASSQ